MSQEDSCRSQFRTEPDNRLAKRNALILAFAQMLAGANGWLIFGTATIAAGGLAPDQSLITVPISTFVLGLWLGTIPTAVISRVFGRHIVFEVGAFCGMLAGLVSAAAMFKGSFWLLCLGTGLGGLYASVHQSYRFAAADNASDDFKPKAISWVLAGGLFGAVLGTQLVIFTKDLSPPYLFAATYLAQAAVAVLAAIVLLFVRTSPPTLRIAARPGRSLVEILRQPRLIAAIGCGVISYTLMNMVMTVAPAAMVGCGYSITAATLGIQWHVIAMFAPSFFTGHLITRFGTQRVVVAGLTLIAAGTFVGASGSTITYFWTGLILLGVGWNFSFTGATTMVTYCHRPEERNKIQGLNDFIVFGATATGSFSSGALLTKFGWASVNEIVISILLITAVLLAPAIGVARRQKMA